MNGWSQLDAPGFVSHHLSISLVFALNILPRDAFRLLRFWDMRLWFKKFYLDHPSKWIMFSNLMFSSCTAMGMSALESRCIIYRYIYIYIYMSFPSDVEVKCCPVLVVLGQTARVGRWFVMWSCLWCRRFLAGIIQLPGIIQLTAQRRLVNPRTPTSVPNLYVQVNEVF